MGIAQNTAPRLHPEAIPFRFRHIQSPQMNLSA